MRSQEGFGQLGRLDHSNLTMLVKAAYNPVHGMLKQVMEDPPKLERILMPYFEIISGPLISLSEIRARRFDIVERGLIIARREYDADWGGPWEYAVEWGFE